MVAFHHINRLINHGPIESPLPDTTTLLASFSHTAHPLSGLWLVKTVYATTANASASDTYLKSPPHPLSCCLATSDRTRTALPALQPANLKNDVCNCNRSSDSRLRFDMCRWSTPSRLLSTTLWHPISYAQHAWPSGTRSCRCGIHLAMYPHNPEIKAKCDRNNTSKRERSPVGIVPLTSGDLWVALAYSKSVVHVKHLQFVSQESKRSLNILLYSHIECEDTSESVRIHKSNFIVKYNVCFMF